MLESNDRSSHAARKWFRFLGSSLDAHTGVMGHENTLDIVITLSVSTMFVLKDTTRPINPAVRYLLSCHGLTDSDMLDLTEGYPHGIPVRWS